MRRAALVGALLALAVPASASAAAPDVGGFHSVLGLGQGQTVNAVDLAAFEAPGGVAPATFTNQLDMYSGVSRGAAHLTPPTSTATTRTPASGAAGRPGVVDQPRAPA